jgi:hypothetical protein
VNVANHSPAITINSFGKESDLSKASAIGPVLSSLFRQAGVQPYASLVEGSTLYVNTTQQKQTIPITGPKKGIVTGRSERRRARTLAGRSDSVNEYLSYPPES